MALRSALGVALDGLEALVEDFQRAMGHGDLCVLLTGPLGAGKTTLVQHFLGPQAKSPTYELLCEHGQALHGDFYRLSSGEELLYLELPLMLEGKNLFFVEWGRKFFPILKKMVPKRFSFYEIHMAQGPQGRDYHLLGPLSD